jgi:hypothetical protein
MGGGGSPEGLVIFYNFWDFGAILGLIDPLFFQADKGLILKKL